jgi:valyl-tRNA synthetase
MAAVRSLVTQVRRFRAGQGLAPARWVGGTLDGAPAGQEAAVRALARLAEPGEGFRPGPALRAGTAVVVLDAGGAVDPAAERARLERALAVVAKAHETVRARLANPAFVERAPAAAVGEARDRLAATAAERDRLTAQLAALAGSAS